MHAELKLGLKCILQYRNVTRIDEGARFVTSNMHVFSIIC